MKKLYKNIIKWLDDNIFPDYTDWEFIKIDTSYTYYSDDELNTNTLVRVEKYKLFSRVNKKNNKKSYTTEILSRKSYSVKNFNLLKLN